MFKDSLRSFRVDRLRTVVDRAETRLIWRVSVGVVAAEEANYIDNICHLGFVGVDFTSAESEVKYAVAFVVCCIEANI